jgi:hypothetical protein
LCSRVSGLTEYAPCAADDCLVDHLPFERNGSPTVLLHLLVRSYGCPSLYYIEVIAEDAVYKRDLLRVDAEFSAQAERAGSAVVRSKPE